MLYQKSLQGVQKTADNVQIIRELIAVCLTGGHVADVYPCGQSRSSRVPGSRVSSVLGYENVVPSVALSHYL